MNKAQQTVLSISPDAGTTRHRTEDGLLFFSTANIGGRQSDDAATRFVTGAF